MRILQVAPYFYPAQAFGGSVQVAYNVGKELVKRGHEVVVFTSDANDRETRINVQTAQVDGMSVYYHRNLSMFLVRKLNLFITPEFRKSVESSLRSFDVIHLHDYTTHQNVVIHRFAKKYGIPYVLQVHGSLPKIGRKGRKWLYDVFFGRRLLRDASKVIALSQVEAEQYKRMGVSEEKIAIIPNGIDLSEYADLPPKGCFKKKFGIKEDEKIVLYLARIHKIKGVDILVRAFANVIKKLDDVRLVVVGPDDGYLGKLESLIRALKIEDRVLISSALYGRDKLEAYVDADVYALPSRYETFPMSVLEAVACGTPIILTENCGIAEYFRNKIGLVVSPDSNHLSEALLEMLLNPDKHDIFVENCKIVRREFDISETVSKLEEIYEAVANNRRPKTCVKNAS
jgi:glycosyltransferase involved in cell wall biosynthesis